jgi:hypothetical protein
MYSVPLWKAMPPTNSTLLAISVPVPCLMTYTPPLGTVWLLPESPANIAPSPQANEVGFFMPLA